MVYKQKRKIFVKSNYDVLMITKQPPIKYPLLFLVWFDWIFTYELKKEIIEGYVERNHFLFFFIPSFFFEGWKIHKCFAIKRVRGRWGVKHFSTFIFTIRKKMSNFIFSSCLSCRLEATPLSSAHPLFVLPYISSFQHPCISKQKKKTRRYEYVK